MSQCSCSSKIDNPDPETYRELVGVGADSAQSGLPNKYTWVSDSNGEIAIRGPRGGIYEPTDYVDSLGNPLYKNNGKLYSMDGYKEHALKRNLPVPKINQHQIVAGIGQNANIVSLDEAIFGLINFSQEAERQSAAQIARISTHFRLDEKRVVLGQWLDKGGYVGEAIENGGIWFETPPEFYNRLRSSLNEDQANLKAWAVNERFLEQQLERGVPRIDLVGETIKEVLINRPKSFTAQEIKFLERKGKNYGYVRIENSWIKVNK